jgi:exonuclease SbcC
VAKTLALHLRSDRFERWLLAEALDALVGGASQILRELSDGQYDLDHDRGEFFVIDHADAGLRRGVRTLSGGETFQASLALALALSDQLAGLSIAAANLESILLDEGFGSLDASTLDTVAATLENLAARGDRMVGVVTHVPALAERIPVRYDVTKDARGVARVERAG